MGSVLEVIVLISPDLSFPYCEPNRGQLQNFIRIILRADLRGDIGELCGSFVGNVRSSDKGVGLPSSRERVAIGETLLCPLPMMSRDLRGRLWGRGTSARTE